jgi:hypothetical protein
MSAPGYTETARRPGFARRSILSIGLALAMSGCLVHPGYSGVSADMTPDEVKRIVVTREFVGKILALGDADVLFDARTGIDRVPAGGLELREHGPSSERSVRAHRGDDGKYAVEIPASKGSWQRSWPPPGYAIDFIASASAEGPMVVRAGRYVMLLSHGLGDEALRRDEVDLAQVIGIHNPMRYALFLGVDREQHRPGLSLVMLPLEDGAVAVGRDGYRVSATALRTPSGGGWGVPQTSLWSARFIVVAERFQIPP